MEILESKIIPERFNVLVYGEPGSGKTRFALTFPGVVIVDFEHGHLTSVDMGMNVPVLKPVNREEIDFIIERPEKVIERIRALDSFKDYDVQTFAFDSITTMQTPLLGNTARKETDLLEAKEGQGILGIARNREGSQPSIQDFGAIQSDIIAIMNGIRQMPYHTVVTAHGALHETEDSPKQLGRNESRVKYKGYPVLIGKVRYHIGGLADIFMFMEARVHGNIIKYYGETYKNDVWTARSRLRNFLDREIENPSFQKIKDAYDRARRSMK